ncbi:hypothetical protein CHS0354_019753 [Potamilus streckersoni]|uniref:Uncharacterized protein n=1 Tax=Potamilus streckersoni TaxID=2493646 RepID=A0AAE0VRZ3_9BIVA|nr:hypothetical protein CHS0354_019753 [Potamilus streckersoni]
MIIVDVAHSKSCFATRKSLFNAIATPSLTTRNWDCYTEFCNQELDCYTEPYNQELGLLHRALQLGTGIATPSHIAMN